MLRKKARGSEMETPTLLIPDIKKETTSWMARITVTEEIPIITCRGDSRMKRYIFTDAEGNDVIASIFDKDVRLLESVIKLFGVYEISNAQIKDIPREFRVMNRAIQWRLQRGTLIRPDTRTPPTLKYLDRDLTPFSSIMHDLDLGSPADIMGVVIEASEITTALTKDGIKDVQRFTFVDNEMKPLSVTIWGPVVQSVGPQLEIAAKKSLVVIARRLTVTYFKGVALSAKNSASFTIEPPIDSAAVLKSWFDSIKERELANMLGDRTVAVCRARFDRGVMRLYSVSELSNDGACGDYWIKGNLSIIEDEQKLFYIACSHCYTKINITEDRYNYVCWVCKRETVSTLRLLVQMRVADSTGVMNVSCIDMVAEQVLGVTPEEFARLIAEKTPLDLDARRAVLGEKQYTMLLRRTYGKKYDDKRRMLLIDYSEDVDVAANVGATEHEAVPDQQDPFIIDGADPVLNDNQLEVVPSESTLPTHAVDNPKLLPDSGSDVLQLGKRNSEGHASSSKTTFKRRSGTRGCKDGVASPNDS